MARALILSLAFAMMLDRIVISVGLDAITESQLKEEIAVTAFLNRQQAPDSLADRRAAAHRLVQQTLISRDMQLARFPPAEAEQVQRTLDRVVEEYGGAQHYEAALKRYGLSAAVLRTHIETQLTTLRFIEYRFRPELTVSENELHSEFDRRTAHWEQDHPGTGKPNFEDSRAALRSGLIEQRTDQALDNWLKQTALQTRVEYVDPSLRPTQ